MGGKVKIIGRGKLRTSRRGAGVHGMGGQSGLKAASDKGGRRALGVVH